MRNLKKILALVLALIMSLSLMATAGATGFKDDAAIADSSYRQAIEVLSGLGVFNGDQNGNFNPEQPITRAEVAAILYRIGTADTSLDGNKTYAPYNQFTDVMTEDWYAGYVTYCANAGWIKGRSNNDFDPKADVTGYEVLAMILRAVGYDKNNEFVGSNWQLNTASIAREKGVLVNVIEDASVQLSAPASRAVVAELLLRAMLLNKVSFSTATLSYNDLPERVCDILGLKEVTGVVVANADADLLDFSNISAKSTQTILWVDAAKGSDIDRDDLVIVNIASDLEAIGEMRTAYMQKTPNRSTYEPVVEELYPVDSVTMNNDYKGGAAGAPTSVGKVADDLDISYIGNYIDYDEASVEIITTDNWRIRYVLTLTPAGSTSAVDVGKSHKKAIEDELGVDEDTGYVYGGMIEVKALTADDVAKKYPHHKAGDVVFDRVIYPDGQLSTRDLALIRGIFREADKYSEKDTVIDFADGEIYAGTASYEDKSDIMNFTTFDKTYLYHDYTSSIGIENGNYVKVIDYDNDGNADFALKREYYLDRVTSVYNGVTYYENFNTNIGTGHYHDAAFRTNSTSVQYAEGVEPKAGDVILRNYIDGVWYGEIVEPVTITVKTVDWKNNKIIDTDGTEWFASGIALRADMDYDILVMDEQVQYNLYLDKGGYIRAYELAQGSNYALLTEMYPTGRNNGAFVTNDNWIAEVMRVDDKYPAEYNLLNSYTNRVLNPFINDMREKTPFNVRNDYANNLVSNFYIDYLQQSIGHLGVSNPQTLTDADNNVNIAGDGNEFKWNPMRETADVESWTNVGKYIMTENGVSLYTATEAATKNGAQLYYAWVDLDDDGVVDHDTETFDVLGTESGLYSSLRKGQKVTWNEWKAFIDSLRTSDKDPDKTLYNTITNNANVDYKTEDGYRYPVLYPVYAVDYIKLAQKSVAAGAAHYDIAATNTEVFANGDGTYASNYSYATGVKNAAKADSYSYLNNDYVDAVDDTEYYLVSGSSIRTFVGRKNVPAVDAKYIRAIYAVAENTVTDLNKNDYWVARVIVIELEGAYSFDSISLAYYNPYQTTSQVQGIDTLNNEADGVELRVHPQDKAWGAQWQGIGFYGLVGQDKQNDLDTASSMEPITGIKDGNGYGFNANHIFAGQISREKTINDKGGYFDIYTDTDSAGGLDPARPNRARATLPVDVPIYGLFSYSVNGRTVVVADGPHNIVESVVHPYDKIIYVTNSTGKVAFVVDLGLGNPNPYAYDSVSDLNATWNAIIAEQNTTPVTPPAERTIVFSRNNTKGRTPAAVPADKTITDIFSSIRIGLTLTDMKEMQASEDGKTYSITITDAPIYYVEYTLKSGYFDGTGSAKTAVKFTSDTDGVFGVDSAGKMTFTPTVAAADSTINVYVVESSIKYDSSAVTTDDQSAVKAKVTAAAKALVKEYVEAKIAAETSADKKAILEANKSTLLSSIDSDINAEIANYPGTYSDEAALQTAIDTLIKKNADGTITGTKTSAIDTAMTSTVSTVTTARDTALNGLAGEITTLSNAAAKTAAANVYNARRNEIETALTVTAIGNNATAAGSLWKSIKDEMTDAANKAVTPEPSVPNMSDLNAGTGIYEDYKPGEKFAGMNAHAVAVTSITPTEGAPNEYDVVATIPVDKSFNSSTPGTFTGFGTASQILSGATSTKFAFITFNIGEENIIYVVGNANASGVQTGEFETNGTVTITEGAYAGTYNLNLTLKFE